MTDKEIINAFECCVSSYDGIACWKCPAVESDICCDDSVVISKGLVDLGVQLMYSQEAEIKDLVAELGETQRIIHEIAEENDWLNETLETTRAEAIKEFAERLKGDEFEIQTDRNNNGYLLSGKEIDDLVKEMVGNSDERK